MFSNILLHFTLQPKLHFSTWTFPSHRHSTHTLTRTAVCAMLWRSGRRGKGEMGDISVVGSSIRYSDETKIFQATNTKIRLFFPSFGFAFYFCLLFTTPPTSPIPISILFPFRIWFFRGWSCDEISIAWLKICSNAELNAKKQQNNGNENDSQVCSFFIYPSIESTNYVNHEINSEWHKHSHTIQFIHLRKKAKCIAIDEDVLGSEAFSGNGWNVAIPIDSETEGDRERES